MAVSILNGRLWFDKYHLSADVSQLDISMGLDPQEATVLSDTAKSIRGTLPFVKMTGSGFITFGTGNVHEALRGNVNVANVPVTVGMEGAVDGTKATSFLTRTLQYRIPGVAGKLWPFTVEAEGQGTPAVDATILGIGAKTVTGNGTSRQLGTLDTGETMYAALHVISVTGTNPTLDVIIQSDTTGFPSPLTRITFAQKTAAGSEWKSLAGPIATDDFWRATWTIGGTATPTFDVVIAVGITVNP